MLNSVPLNTLTGGGNCVSYSIHPNYVEKNGLFEDQTQIFGIRAAVDMKLLRIRKARAFKQSFNLSKRERGEIALVRPVPDISINTFIRFPSFSRLPAEIVQYIDEFNPRPVMKQVCRRFRNLLRQRHYKRFPYYVTNENASDVVKSIQAHSTTLANFILRSRRFRNVRTNLDSLEPLKESVHTMEIDLKEFNPVNANCQFIARLRLYTALHTLRLILNYDLIGDAGAQQISKLNIAPSLEILYLELRHNNIGNVGAKALSDLKFSPVLCNLHLDLDCNRIENLGALALSTMLDFPSKLNTLVLTLDEGRGIISGPGELALWTLKNHRLMVPPSFLSWKDEWEIEDDDDHDYCHCGNCEGL
jgi:hypothetical protein